TARRRAGATARRHHPNPAEAHRRWRGERSKPVRLGVRDHHTRSLGAESPAQTEQWCCWLLPPAAHLLIERDRGQFLPSWRRSKSAIITQCMAVLPFCLALFLSASLPLDASKGTVSGSQMAAPRRQTMSRLSVCGRRSQLSYDLVSGPPRQVIPAFNGRGPKRQ